MSKTHAKSTAQESLLIEKVVEHDSVSFSKLYDQYLPLICKVWYQFHLTELPLEDWKKEAAVVLYRTSCSYYNHCQSVRFCWYLRQALLNKIRDLYRQQVAKKRIPVENVEPITDLHIDQRLVDAHFRPDDASEFRYIYRQFLQSCSLLERDAFTMINSGHCPEEIAHRLSCSPLSIRSAFERARQKFLRYLYE